VQFHPEVTHTPHGFDILRNFLYEVCKCAGTWRMADFLETATKRIREKVGERRVICGLSGVKIRRHGGFKRGAGVRAAGGEIAEAVEDHEDELGVRFNEEFGVECVEVHGAGRFQNCDVKCSSSMPDPPGAGRASSSAKRLFRRDFPAQKRGDIAGRPE
jgi:hypothetical protein